MMKNFELRNVFKLCVINISNTKKSIIGWSIAIFSIMSLYMILFPSIKDMAQIKLDVLPQELMQFVGMSSMADMSNFTTYFGMIYGIILIAISIFSATYSSSLIRKEEQTKSIEFLNALTVSKTEIYISKYITSYFVTLIIVLCAIISTIICGFIGGGETFNIIDILTASKFSSLTPFIFGGLGLMFAGISPKLGTGALSSAIVLVSYVLGYLGELLTTSGEFLLYFSPFSMLSVKNVLSNESGVTISLIIYFAIYVISIIIGCMIYNKRDLKI